MVKLIIIAIWGKTSEDTVGESNLSVFQNEVCLEIVAKEWDAVNQVIHEKETFSPTPCITWKSRIG